MHQNISYMTVHLSSHMVEYIFFFPAGTSFKPFKLLVSDNSRKSLDLGTQCGNVPVIIKHVWEVRIMPSFPAILTSYSDISE